MKDLMIDIETMSTAGDALVLSIGVTPFTCTDAGVEVGDALLLSPDFMDQLLLGRRVDRSTQMWWADQSIEAQQHWRTPERPMRLREAMVTLNTFVSRHIPDRVWARGPHFDIAILDSLYLELSIKSPWKYNSIRDVRTYCDDRQETRSYGDTATMPYPKHHPLRDNFDQIVDLWQHGMGVGVMPQDRDCEGTTTVVLP